jgi:protein-S-isoprenylcysteine O-methyltransferase Ste14
MIRDSITRQGSWLFRWRSYILLVFAPLMYLALSGPEPVESYLGEAADFTYEAICIAIAFAGLAIRAFTVGFVPAGTSGRNTHSQIAETLNTTGLYSLTRNPLYFGNAVIYTGIALFTQNVYFVVVMILFLVIYLERIIATEEDFLTNRFPETYPAWAKDVPAFFPRLHGWKRPALGFSFRNVLRREYSGFFAIIATLAIVDSAREYLTEPENTVDEIWLLAFIIGALIYIILRALKKHTNLLTVDGR